MARIIGYIPPVKPGKNKNAEDKPKAAEKEKKDSAPEEAGR